MHCNTNKSLVHFHLIDIIIDDECAKGFSATFQYNRLGSISMHDAEISNDGSKAIATSLIYNTSLEFVDLNNNLIGDDGAKAFATALQHNKVIKQVLLTSNIGISDDVKKSLNTKRLILDD